MQVDSIIVNGTLFSHPKIFNPDKKPLQGYWWTCVGHHLLAPNQPCKPSPGNPGSRIITSAPVAFDSGSDGPLRVSFVF